MKEVYVDGCSHMCVLGPISKLKLFSLTSNDTEEPTSEDVQILTMSTSTLISLTKHLAKVFEKELSEEKSNEN